MKTQKLVLALVLVLAFSVAPAPAPISAATDPGPFEVGQELLIEDTGIPVSSDVEFDEEIVNCQPLQRPEKNPAVIYYPKAGGEIADGVFPLIVYGHGHRVPDYPDDCEDECERCELEKMEPESITEDYQQVSAVLRHLASWGFVVISPDLSWLAGDTTGDYLEDRQRVLRDAVNYMLAENSRAGSLFEGKIRPTGIGAMGHSIGAYATILLGVSEGLRDKIGAVALIAPPKISSSHKLWVQYLRPKPVMLLQGTNDYFYTVFEPSTAEEIYGWFEGWAQTTKHLVTIEGAPHFGYTDNVRNLWEEGDAPHEIIPREDQQDIAKAYLAAFFQRYLKPGLGCVNQLHRCSTGAQPCEGLEDFEIGFPPDDSFDGSEPFEIEVKYEIGEAVLCGELNWIFTKIADTNTAIPEGTGDFTQLHAPSINDDGIVAFLGAGDDQRGIYTYRRYPIPRFRVVADTNTSIPGAIGNFTRFGFPVIDDEGNVAFWAAGDDQEGIYTYIGGTLGVVVDTAPGPDGLMIWRHLGMPSLDAGNVAFWGARYDREGIYTDVGGELNVVADTNGCCGTWPFTDFGAYPSLEDGHVAFLARTGEESLWILTDQPHWFYFYTPVARTSVSTIPCGTETFTTFYDPVLSNGNAVFWGYSADQNGIYTGLDFRLDALVDTNTIVPGETGTFDVFYYPLSADHGNVAFNGILVADAGPGQWGIYTTVNEMLSKVIDLDTSLDGKSIERDALPENEVPMHLWHGGLSRSSVAFTVNFIDSSKAIYRASLDSDWDLAPDFLELALGTHPLNPDSDGDELMDGVEVELGTDPLDPDSDDDELMDGVEVELGTDPLDPDSDGDELMDGVEVGLGTDPLSHDTDNDELTDGIEVELGSDPLNPDTDGDGIPDGEDVEWLQNAVDVLPEGALKDGDSGLRTAMSARLDAVERKVAKGQIGQALNMLENLRKRVDGCGATPDPNDWIIACDAQVVFRELLDIYRLNLQP